VDTKNVQIEDTDSQKKFNEKKGKAIKMLIAYVQMRLGFVQEQLGNRCIGLERSDSSLKVAVRKTGL
jgi:hypothetical protein